MDVCCDDAFRRTKDLKLMLKCQLIRPSRLQVVVKNYTVHTASQAHDESVCIDAAPVDDFGCVARLKFKPTPRKQ